MIRNILLALAALAGISSAAQAANLVADGDFSVPSGGATYTTYNAGQVFGPWNVTSGSVDLIGNYWQSPSVNGGSVDLDGNVPGGISQSLTLNPGTYVLNFSLSGNPDGGAATKSMMAAIGGTSNAFSFVTGANTKSGMNYITETLQFAISGVGPQNEVLTFLSLDPSGPYGAAIGNVSISAVPLPASALLFGTALLGMGAFAYRRRSL